MDIWNTLYQKEKEQYHPEDVSPFVMAHHVICALEAENGEIFSRRHKAVACHSSQSY